MEYNINFNHDKKRLAEAIGVNIDEMKQKAISMFISVKSLNFKPSETIEVILNSNLNDAEKILMIIWFGMMIEKGV
jgi:hypothetical protein